MFVQNREVQVVSSHSYVVERSGIGSQVGLRVGMSPLVSAITDSILDLAKMGIEPQFVSTYMHHTVLKTFKIVIMHICTHVKYPEFHGCF